MKFELSHLPELTAQNYEETNTEVKVAAHPKARTRIEQGEASLYQS